MGNYETGNALRAIARQLAETLGRAPDAIDLAVTTLAAGGDLLLEDVPGVGKTLLAKALARSIGGDVRRIQFTPDMLPGDLTGLDVYSPQSQRFDFHPGPLFANVVIADEINRANPKTQAAMLEAMGERQVSVDGVTYALPEPFFVIATQNPIEMEGTYPLPEAQLDRFMARASLGYPDRQAQVAMLLGAERDPLDGVRQIVSGERMRRIQDDVAAIALSAPVADYAARIVEGTRTAPGVRYGASPRAALHLAALARGRAAFDGRDFVMPDDIRELAVPALAHRLVMDAPYGAQDAAQAVQDVVAGIAPPRAADGGKRP